ncbi:MAG: carboxypeptidase-like regulatory domain-containing protein [Candidatus Azobacteroides sp.]|nr:carboxypeptidase-like regulatory domain-containing protein [Candidatus Azobacteroides sp.]
MASSLHCLFSQSVIISGKITGNKNEAVEFVVVTLNQGSDSSVVAYSTTDENGYYQLTTTKKGKFYVRVNYLGYAPQMKPLELTGNENISDFNFVLEPDTVALQEVVIKSRKTGVLFDNDTIRYDPAFFKDGTEVVLGDLLNKLPGIEVDEKGNVQAHGKKVDKLLLNGQDFFQGNVQTATKNLSADIAETIDVMNNYSEYSLLSGFQSQEKTVINVGVNKSKLGKISGNISGGGGIENKYEARGDLMQINPTWMTSIIGAGNNSGNEIFSIEDYIRLQGGVSEFTGNQGQQNNLSLSEEEQKMLIPRNNVHKRNSGLGGVNFSYQPKDAFKINSYLLYNKSKESAEERNKYTYLLPENRQYATSDNLNINDKNKLFSGFVKMSYQPAPLWNIVYKGLFSKTGMNENTDAINQLPDQQMQTIGNANANKLGTGHNIAVMKSIKKHLFIAEASFMLDNKPFSYGMQSDSLLLPLPLTMYDNYYYGRQDTKLKNTTVNIGFSLFYRINNAYFLRAGIGATGTKQAYYSGIYRTNPGEEAILLPDENLKNDYSLQMNDYNTNLNLIKNKGLFRFKVGASVHTYDFKATRVRVLNNRKTVKLNPEMEMSLHFSDKHSLNLSGYKSEQLLPAETFLYGIVFDDYQSYSHNSQVNQWQNTQYNLNLTYRIFDLYYNTMVILVGGYGRSNTPSTVNYFSNGLLTERYPILSVPADNMYFRLYANKGLSAIPWTLKLTGGYNANSFSNQSAGKNNSIRIKNLTGKFQILTNYRRVFNTEWKAELELIDNFSSLGSIKAQTIQRYSGELKFNFGKRFRANVELEHAINRSLDINLYKWYLNTSIYYKLNNKADINLSGLNILNLKNQDWVSVSYNGIYIAEKNFGQIPGNLLLKLNYRF